MQLARVGGFARAQTSQAINSSGAKLSNFELERLSAFTEVAWSDSLN
jgi:hypothetical protein